MTTCGRSSGGTTSCLYFLPAEADFTPDLEGVINGLDADDSFLNSLRSMVGLNDAPAGRMAIIEPSPGGGPWRITTLDNGRPLESLISVVVEDWHREPVRRLLDTERVDLTSDRRRYEEQWLAVGGRETAELAGTHAWRWPRASSRSVIARCTPTDGPRSEGRCASRGVANGSGARKRCTPTVSRHSSVVWWH